MGLGTTTMQNTAWNTLTTTARQQWYNPGKARDVISKGTPFLFYLMLNAQEKIMLGQTLAVRLIDTRNVPTAYSYWDTLSTAPFKGATAGEVTVAQYNAPLAISEQEILEMTGPDAMIDRYKQMVTQTEMGFAYRFGIDVFAGNTSDSKRMLGLEQIYYPKTQYDVGTAAGSAYSAETTLVYSADRWRFRAANNTYAGITRAAFTNDDVTGTGWENVACNFFNTMPAYSTTAPYPPDNALKCLDMTIQHAGYGGMKPKIGVTGPKVYDSLKHELMGKTTIWKTAEAFGGGELLYESVMINGLMVLRDDYCKYWGTTISGGATNDDLVFYALHCGGDDGTHKLLIDPRMNFDITETRTPVDQHAGVQHMRCRLQQFSESPRNGAVGFNFD